MKIGLDIRIIGTAHGGIGRYVFELAKRLPLLDKSNDYYLFFREKDSQTNKLLSSLSAPNLYFIKSTSRHYSLSEQVKFLSLLNKYKLDLVHFPNFNVPLFYKRPFLVTIHDLVHHKIGGAKKSNYLHFLAYKRVIQSAANRSKKIITVSKFSKNEIVKILQVPESKVSVVYQGAEFAKNVSEQEVRSIKKTYLLNSPYFLFVGVLERKKNIVNLTRGFDELVKKYRYDMDLVVVGKQDSHYPEVKFKAMDIKNKNRLVFTGPITDAQLSCLYKGAYAFVSASLHEGFGLPGVEAMQFGLPLAVSNTEVFNEIYDDAGIYFNPLDPLDICEKINLLVRDPEFYAQMQVKSVSRGALFSWDKAALETLEVYRQALKD